MAYRKPSTAVYQELENSGGAAQVTPDLQAVIIGPLFNEVTIDPTDDVSLTRAKSAAVDHWYKTGDVRKMIELPLNAQSVYPGQKVMQDGSVSLYVMNAQVKTYAFSVTGLTFKEPTTASQFTVDTSAVKFGFADSNPLAPIALGDKGAHVRAGDLLIVSDGTNLIETTVSSVKMVGATSMEMSVTDSLSALDKSQAVTFEVYHLFSGLDVNIHRVNPDDVDLTKLYLGQEVLGIANNYQMLNTTAKDGSYTLRSPAQSGGQPIQTYIGYRARRMDTVRDILTITKVTGNLESQLGKPSPTNPLALGVSIAQANTTTSLRAVAVEDDSLESYKKALQLVENERVYALCPLTSDMDIITMFKAHAVQMSDPLKGMWRVSIVSSDPSDVLDLGSFSGSYQMTKSSSAEGGRHNMILAVPGATFLTDKIQAGDTISITAAVNKAVEGAYKIDTVYSNTMLGIKTGLEGEMGYIPEIETTVNSFQIFRNLDSHAKAANIAAISKNLGSNRVWHIMPCMAGVVFNKVTQWVPSYYIGCAVAGMVAGFPVQQGFTNLTIAGIVGLKGSNYYFDSDDLNVMAAAGTCIFVQDNQSAPPYCRHELTTDMTVLEYREMLKVKNWDYLSYFYKDILDPFIGNWNIVDDTLRVIRQTIISASENLKTQKLPRIGAPLVDYQITKLEQNATTKDKIDCYIKTSIVDPNNYTDVHLVI